MRMSPTTQPIQKNERNSNGVIINLLKIKKTKNQVSPKRCRLLLILTEIFIGTGKKVYPFYSILIPQNPTKMFHYPAALILIIITNNLIRNLKGLYVQIKFVRYKIMVSVMLKVSSRIKDSICQYVQNCRGDISHSPQENYKIGLNKQRCILFLLQ